MECLAAAAAAAGATGFNIRQREDKYTPMYRGVQAFTPGAEPCRRSPGPCGPIALSCILWRPRLDVWGGEYGVKEGWVCNHDNRYRTCTKHTPVGVDPPARPLCLYTFVQGLMLVVVLNHTASQSAPQSTRSMLTSWWLRGMPTHASAVTKNWKQ